MSNPSPRETPRFHHFKPETGKKLELAADPDSLPPIFTHGNMEKKTSQVTQHQEAVVAETHKDKKTMRRVISGWTPGMAPSNRPSSQD